MGNSYCMKTSKLFRTLVTAVLFTVAASAVPALAVTQAGIAIPVPYVAAFTPTFGISGVPYAGTMQLVMNDGTVTGTYTGISVRPDRLNDRIVPVTGSVDTDGYLQFNVGGALWFTGRLAADGSISGTADYNGKPYNFMASPGAPGRPI
jgi:hypothetical protein